MHGCPGPRTTAESMAVSRAMRCQRRSGDACKTETHTKSIGIRTSLIVLVSKYLSSKSCSSPPSFKRPTNEPCHSISGAFNRKGRCMSRSGDQRTSSDCHSCRSYANISVRRTALTTVIGVTSASLCCRHASSLNR